MDEVLKELEKKQEDADWRESRRLVFYILRDVNAKLNKVEQDLLGIKAKVALAGAIAGVAGSVAFKTIFEQILK